MIVTTPYILIGLEKAMHIEYAFVSLTSQALDYAKVVTDKTYQDQILN